MVSTYVNVTTSAPALRRFFHFPGGGVIQFGNNPLLPGVWIAAATSLPLGNIEIDQAVVSTIAARIAAAKVMLVRMTPTSRLE
jgi:hypothetical protein